MYSMFRFAISTSCLLGVFSAVAAAQPNLTYDFVQSFDNSVLARIQFAQLPATQASDVLSLTYFANELGFEEGLFISPFDSARSSIGALPFIDDDGFGNLFGDIIFESTDEPPSPDCVIGAPSILAVIGPESSNDIATAFHLCDLNIGTRGSLRVVPEPATLFPMAFAILLFFKFVRAG